MKSLVALSCLLAIATARPSVSISNGAHLIPQATYSYTTYTSGSALATPLVHSAPAPVIPAVPITAVEKTQYHSQDELGQASYGHSEPLQTHNAVQDAAGNKLGSYSYIAPDGQIISTSYVADALGYRVASNAVPVGPGIVPVAPSETPEVLAARAAHLRAYELVKSRSRRSVAIATPIAYSGLYLAYSTPIVHSAALPVTHTVPLAPIASHSASYII